jgi:hypothetical protein
MNPYAVSMLIFVVSAGASLVAARRGPNDETEHVARAVIVGLVTALVLSWLVTGDPMWIIRMIPEAEPGDR